MRTALAAFNQPGAFQSTLGCRVDPVKTPVARWVLIARGTAYSTRFPFISSDGGLPHTDARSATTLDVSRPAQRSLALRPVGSPHRQSDTSFSKAPMVSLPPPPPR